MGALTRPSSQEEALLPFRPQEYSDCCAIILTPKAKNIVPVNGTPRLEVVAELTAFEQIEDIENNDPDVEGEEVLTWGKVASMLNGALMNRSSIAARVVLGDPTSKGTRPWLLVDLDRNTEAAVSAWLERQ